MLIEVVKDEHTKIVREATEAEAAVLAASFPVNVVAEDGTKTPFGVAPEPEAEAPAEKPKAAKAAAVKPAAKKAAKKR